MRKIREICFTFYSPFLLKKEKQKFLIKQKNKF